MTYIFLVAGKGSRLHPITLKHPKSLYKLSEETTVIKRMVSLIKKYDDDAKIIIVGGFKFDMLVKELEDVVFINNPFYSVTNSIASLWFAAEYLEGDVTIINGDIVMASNLVQEVLIQPVEKTCVLLDSSIKKNGDYNVQVNDNKVVVMSKELSEYYGEYAGVTKISKDKSTIIKDKIKNMINEGLYEQWYENALVQMIFEDNFELEYIDIKSYDWTEVDCVDDLTFAKKIEYFDKIIL